MLKQIASDHSHLCSQFSRNINANLTFAENAILNLFNISLTNFKWTIVVCLGSGQNYFTRTDVTKPQNRWWSLPILPSSTTTALTPLARSKKKCWSLPCSERFFSGYSGFPLSSKTNTSKFQFDLESVPN